jgi:predicted permease
MNAFFRKLSWLPKRHQKEEELEEELQFHLEEEAEERRASGATKEEARYAALRDLGNVTLVKEDTRATWGWTLVEQFFQDMRYAFRTMAANKAFSALAIGSLAVGIGANTAMFSVVNAVLLRPLPFHDPQRLVALSEDIQEKPSSGPTGLPPSSWTFSYPDFMDVRARSRSFEAMAAYENDNFTMTGDREAIHVRAETVSASLFGLLEVQPELGRGFLESEDAAGHHVIVLSDRLWHTYFNADRGILGQTVRLNGVIFSIVGVMPQGFQFPIRAEAIDLWITFSHDVEIQKNTPMPVQRDYHGLEVVARIKPDVSLQQANAELTSIAQALATEYPTTNTHTAIGARPELESLVRDTRAPLQILLAAVGLVLLITCANVANLLLARGTGRAREMAVRIAIGVSRSRIVRQLVTESLVLSIAGATLGIVAAYGALSGALRLYPSNLPRAQEVGIDLRVLAFTIGIAIMTGTLFGLAPAMRASRPYLSEAIREGGWTSTASPRQNRLRSGLVIAETALGIVLVTAAVLLVRSFERLSRSDLGFNPSHLLTAHFNLSETRYNPEQEDHFIREFFSRLRVLPGVTAAAGALPLPLSDDTWFANFTLADHPVPKENQPMAGYYVVVPGFFEAMKIPLISGRTFDDRDQRNSMPVVIVTQTFAKKFFPNEDPIGRRIIVEVTEGSERESYRTRQVIGVVGDIRRSNLRMAPTPAYYVPLSQLIRLKRGIPSLVLRAGNDPTSLTGGIRETLTQMDPEVALYDVRDMDDYLALDLGLARFQTALLSLFAGIALLLTAVGLYGVMAYSVGQRLNEIGVRQALGATTWDILWLVMERGVMLTLAGVGIGIIGALAVARFMGAFLYEVPSHDPLSYLTASLALGGVGLLACYIPALRATRVDPLVVLRHQ